VRGVIETECDRVTFEAPILTWPDNKADAKKSIFCLDDEPSSK
jgi:hypothetical protein